jgi:hypothetical protein
VLDSNQNTTQGKPIQLVPSHSYQHYVPDFRMTNSRLNATNGKP